MICRSDNSIQGSLKVTKKQKQTIQISLVQPKLLQPWPIY